MNKPIRKRAYYRAIKSKRMWLICSYEDFERAKLLNGPNTFADWNCPSGEGFYIWPILKVHRYFYEK